MSAADHRRPQLSMEELLQLKWLLGGLLTLLAAGTIVYMEVEAWTLMVLVAAATVATLVWPALPGRVPRLVHTLAFPAILAFFAGDLWLKTEILPAMVRLDLMLLLYRSITYRERRDDLQVVVLGLFLVVVAGVLTVSLTFAAHLLVYTGCALALLFAITLTDAANAGRKTPPIPPGTVPAWAQRAEWGPLARRLHAVADWRVLALGAALFAGVVAVSALLFLAIPRFQLENSMFLDRFISKKAKSGFSDTIKFGDVTDIQQDDSIALSVDVSDRSAIPASPYWRMVVLDHYENGTFRFSQLLRGQSMGPERTAGQITGEAKPRRGDGVSWTFYLESGISRYLPLLGHFELLRFRESQNFRFAPHVAIVGLREEPAAMTAYRVDGFEPAGALPDAAFARRWRERARPEQRTVALQSRLTVRAEDRAALERIVAEATGGAALPAAEFTRRMNAWLRSNHGYSLSPRIPAGEGDPLVRWAASREEGHCELFAGSFVLLARTAGFAARVVTGFRGGSWNAYSNNFTIRNADAHAWAEIFDETTESWLRADPLAPEAAAQTQEVRGEAAIASRLDRSWKARLDSLRVFWYRRIVSFDQRSQAETLKAVKEATQASGVRLRAALTAWVDGLKAWLAQPWDVRRFAEVLAWASSLAAAVWFWRGWGRRWWRDLRPTRGPGHEDPVRREAGRWLARLAAAGPAGAEPAPEIARAAAELQRLRFGPRGSWPEPEAVFRRARQAWRAARRPVRAG